MSKDTNRRHNAVVMLEVLLSGMPVKFDDQEYYYQDGMFGIRGTKYSCCDNPGREVLLQCDLSLQDFIKLCEKMSPEEVYLQGCAMVLTLYNRRERGKA